MIILSAEEFVRLRSSRIEAEYHLAAHGEATLDVWRDVVVRYPDYREWVIHNKTVPIEILNELANEENSRVRQSVAEKRKLTPELFEQLARDSDSSVRNMIVHNPKTPDQLLELLTEDPEDWVASNARERIEYRHQKKKNRP